MEADGWGWYCLNEEGVLRAFERTSVGHHFPVRDAFGAELFTTGPRALSRFERNGIANLALVLFEHMLVQDGILNGEGVLLHKSLATKK